MKKLILLFSIFFILYACNNNGNESSFLGNEKNIVPQPIETACLVGRPSEIISIDSILLICDPYEGQAITVIDTKNNRCIRRFLNIGQGPGEVVLPLKLCVSEGKKINVFQMQTGLLNTYDIKDIINTELTPVLQEQVKFEDRPANIKRITDGFIGIGMFEDGRYTYYDENGKHIQTAGNYPFRGNNMKPIERFFLYQGVLCANPSANYYALGTSYCDNLEFFRIENDKVTLIRKYETYDVDGAYNQTIMLSDDCKMAYKGAYGTNKYCYMLYSGKKYGEKSSRSTGGNIIIVFDWNGTFIRSFKSEKTIISICVNETDDILYAVTYNQEEGFTIDYFNL
jgi:hypothetical protein